MKVIDILSLAQQYPSLNKSDFSHSVKIKLITNFTDQILQRMLIGVCMQHSIYPEIKAVPYRQYDLYLSDRKSFLFEDQADITFIFFDTSALNHSPFNDQTQGHFEKIYTGLAALSAAVRESVIISTFSKPFKGPYGNLFEQHGLFRTVENYNEKYRGLAAQFSNVHILDIDRLVHRFGENNVRDLRGMYAFDIPFTSEFFLKIAEEWTSYILHLRGKVKKCLVLDLDNTLWGGVVGEVGPDGVALGPQYPGVAFQNFQRAILSCFEKGMVLAINSKNNEADVREIFEKNRHMILKMQHFAAMRINWNNKVENLISIAGELNLGLDSFVFIDDDPLNREMVKSHLPGVLVPDFTLPPEKYVDTLYSLPIYNQFKLTDEDKVKGRLYAEEKIRKEILAKTVSIEDYVSALGLSIKVRRNEKQWIPRLSQLTMKTNQFNATTRRYGEKEIELFMEKGVVYAAEIDDKFGSYGVTVLCIIEIVGDRAKTEVFLMSCRVMGRGIEELFMDYIIKDLGERGVRLLSAEFIPTPKNAPVRDFFGKVGFTEVNRDKSGKIDYTLTIEDYNNKAHSLAELIKLIVE